MGEIRTRRMIGVFAREHKHLELTRGDRHPSLWSMHFCEIRATSAQHSRETFRANKPTQPPFKGLCPLYKAAANGKRKAAAIRILLGGCVNCVRAVCVSEVTSQGFADPPVTCSSPFEFTQNMVRTKNRPGKRLCWCATAINSRARSGACAKPRPTKG